MNSYFDTHLWEYNIDIKVDLDLSDYKFDLINLSERYFAKPEIERNINFSVVKMNEFNSDVLIIGENANA